MNTDPHPTAPENRTESPLQRIRIVLVGTTHTGNLGAVARALKTMGLERLHLVQPKSLPDAQAIARASGADDLLASAPVHDRLIDALAGCRLVIGTSARLRTVEWPVLEPPDCARRLTEEAAQGDVALVFGRECSGLTNEELQACHYLGWIPTNPDFCSLNLAAAVQIFAYEIRRAATRGVPSKARVSQTEPASSERIQGLHAHLMETLIAIGFAQPHQSKTLSRRLRRFLNRARPDTTEIDILRGILRAVQRRHPSD